MSPRWVFSRTEDHGTWTLQRAYEAFPQEAAQGVADQLIKGRPLPFRADELLRQSNIALDQGPTVERVLNSVGDQDGAEAIAAVSGPHTIGLMIDRSIRLIRQLRQSDRPAKDSLYDPYRRASALVALTKASAFATAMLQRPRTTDPADIAELADLIGRHGRDVENRRLAVDDNTRESVARLLIEWADILLSSQDATRGQMAEIADAAARLGSPSLVPSLKRLLSEDLTRLATEREERQNARREGRQIQNDAAMSYVGQYANAFASIGDEATIALMKAYLPNFDFGIEAAKVLQRIWRKTVSVEDIRVLLWRSPDFSVVKDRRASRASAKATPAHPFAQAMFSVAEEFLTAESTQTQRHALALGAIAVSFPYAGHEATIERLLALPRPALDKQRLLMMLALAGEVVPAKLVLQGLEDLLEEAKTKPWILSDQESWRFDDWLTLLPFSDDPQAILGALDQLPAQHKVPWKMRAVLKALGDSASNESVNALLTMAKSDTRLLAEHDWLAALSQIGSIDAARALFNLVCDEAVLQKIGREDKRSVGQHLASLIATHPQFRREVYERYIALQDGLSRTVVGYAIAEIADDEAVFTLLRSTAARNLLMENTGLYVALKQVLVGTRPSTMGSGFQEYFGMPAAALRQGLFGLFIRGTAEESRLAHQCLVAIDEIRDDYGSIESEPRHPDISTGVPWPQV